MTWPPLAPGETAHSLSLTADEGTWIKLSDFAGHLNVVLVFFRSLTDDGTDAWLLDWHRRRSQLEELETVVFGVHTARTDQLREFRHRLGLILSPLSPAPCGAAHGSARSPRTMWS
jgi:peroxiredoxin